MKLADSNSRFWYSRCCSWFLASLSLLLAFIGKPSPAQDKTLVLSEQEIIKMLDRHTPQGEIKRLVRERHIDFQVTAELEKDLKDNHRASDELIDALRQSQEQRQTRSLSNDKSHQTPLPGTRMEALSLPFNVTMDFVWIPPGEFEMGCSSNDASCSPSSKPQHKVRITKGFEMSIYKVTHQQWAVVMRSKNVNSTVPVGWAMPTNYGYAEYDRLDIHQFLAKLNARDDKYIYRQPTEAEWEYAARAGTAEELYGPLDEIAWYDKNSGGIPHPVGQKKPNAWGLFDMIGNVEEWCSDRYSPDYYKETPVNDPKGPDHGIKPQGRERFTLRSSNYLSPASSMRVSGRAPGPDGYESNFYYGFRVVRQRRNP